MKAKENLLKEKKETRSYLAQINWDWWFLKGQLILGSILLTGLIFYGLWFS